MGPRVFIRPPRAEDTRAYIALVRRSRAFHRPWIYLSDDPGLFRRRVRAAADLRNRSLFAFRREDAALVGVVNLSEIVRGVFLSAYMGYFGHADYAGQGYVREAVALALEHAFRDLRLHRVEANIQPGNTASIALAKACGFRYEGFSPRYLKIGGRWRDHERWSCLADANRRRVGKTRARMSGAS